MHAHRRRTGATEPATVVGQRESDAEVRNRPVRSRSRGPLVRQLVSAHAFYRGLRQRSGPRRADLDPGQLDAERAHHGVHVAQRPGEPPLLGQRQRLRDVPGEPKPGPARSPGSRLATGSRSAHGMSDGTPRGPGGARPGPAFVPSGRKSPANRVALAHTVGDFSCRNMQQRRRLRSRTAGSDAAATRVPGYGAVGIADFGGVEAATEPSWSGQAGCHRMERHPGEVRPGGCG